MVIIETALLPPSVEQLNISVPQGTEEGFCMDAVHCNIQQLIEITSLYA